MQQIADTLGTDITTFSRQVQSLIKMNLVKTQDPQDRRVYTLALTTEGKFIATTIDQQMNDYLNEVFSYMTEFEKKPCFTPLRFSTMQWPNPVNAVAQYLNK